MKRAWVFLIAILLLATALRLYRVADMSLRGDEAANVFLAMQEPDAITRVFISEDPHLPLFFWMLHYWMLVAGHSELAVRYPTILVGVLVVAFAYVLSKRLFLKSENIALIGALGVAINPYLIWDAQDAYMYSFLTASTLISMILFVRVIQNRVSWRAWISYALINTLGLYFHYLAGLVIITQGALALLWRLTRRISVRRFEEWFVAQVLTLTAYTPWLVFVFPLLTSFNLILLPPTDPIEMLMQALVAFSVGLADSRLMPPMVDPVVGYALAFGFLGLFVLGFVSLRRERWSIFDGRVVLAIALAVPLIVIFIFSIWRFPIFDERYVLFLIPMFALMVARGVNTLRESKFGWTAIVAGGFVILASGYSLNNYFHVPAFAKSPDWRGLVQYLVADAQPGDALIQNYPDPALTYYLDNRLPRILLPRTDSATMTEVSADLTLVATKYNRLWFQPFPYSMWDAEGLVALWFNRHARQVATYKFRGADLALYLPASAVLRQAQSIDATFANAVQLLAFECDTTIQPGVPINVTLYWILEKRAERDTTVFLHMYDDAGMLVAQQDNPPVNGTYALSEWNVNVVVVDAYTLTMPADAPLGRYTLAVGMYDSQTQTRLGVVKANGQAYADDRVALTALQVRQ